jgi:diketogulonate reductase-like aldo/keto reductase
MANGLVMPQIQLGLYMMSRKEASQSVPWALNVGYLGFDSAQMYHNEKETGHAIRDWLSSSENTSGLERKDIHYTSKLSSNSASYDAVRRSIKKSVDACGLGYIDLFLLHSPYGGKEARLASWRALEDAIDAGEVLMGGVSNYGVHHVGSLVKSPWATLPYIVLTPNRLKN